MLNFKHLPALVIQLMLIPLTVGESINVESSTCDIDYVGEGENTFFRIHEFSKYLYNPMASFISLDATKSLCHSMDLEVAEINTQAEYRSIVRFIKSDPKIGHRQWSLGFTRDETGENFVMQNGEPMKFQVFLRHRPTSKFNNKCVSFGLSESMYYVMIDESCKTKVFPLCQFKRNTDCSRFSMEARFREPKGLLKMYETTKYKYYMGIKQKTWSEALRHCIDNGKELLDLVDEFEVEEVNTMFSSFLLLHGRYEGSGVWTSGKFKNEVKDNLFEWVSRDIPAIWNGSQPLWSWVNGEPCDPTLNHLETCVLMYHRWGSETPFLSASNCKYPQYYICYEDRKNYTKPVPEQIIEEDEVINGPEGLLAPKPQVPCYVIDPPKLNLTIPGLTLKETFDLLKFNIKHNIQEDNVVIKLKESDWRRPMVTALNSLTKHACPNNYVSREFINLMSNMMLIYYNSVVFKHTDEIDKSSWDKYVKILDNCTEHTEPLDLVGNVEHIISMNGDTIIVQEERADLSSSVPDMVIESFWYMFQMSVGTCFITVNKEVSYIAWMAAYYQKFVEEFLHDLIPRWQFAGTINYASFLGDYEVAREMYNLRMCSVAAFESNSINHFYFLRPFEFSREANYKTGDEVPSTHYTDCLVGLCNVIQESDPEFFTVVHK